ncbi:hypothetical protein ACFWN7_15140 [Agromyces sp. NPDC058484]|uniref:hypothetical protein n=1 Tax=Agromyces sp. NPDC058484 TaxID=3346524 RepID=UPI00365C6472
MRVIHAAGVSPTQVSPERIVHVDLFGTAYVLDTAHVASSPRCCSTTAATATPTDL